MNDTLCIEITVDRDSGGFLYLAYVDNEDEPTMIGSGHAETLEQTLHILKGLTERTL